MAAEVMETRKRDLLNLWASDFLFRYQPDKVEDIEYKQICELLIETEKVKGEEMFDAPSISQIQPSQLYRYAEAKARTWQIPITRIGLCIAHMGCHSAHDIDMVLAVLYNAYTKMRRTADDVIDGLFVWEVLKHGTPSRDLLDTMWEMQKGTLTDGLTPLMERLTAEDFR